MKWLSGGLTFVTFFTVAGLLLGIVAGGLSNSIATSALSIGFMAGLFAYFQTYDRRVSPEPAPRYRNLWLFTVAGFFAIFAFRSFIWLLYRDDDFLRIQSPNNLGDLALHITYLKNFANGVPLWPDNPIYVLGKLRYPAGMDLLNGLVTLLGVDMTRGLIWAGLLASLATFYALWRWGGTFGVAGFLFNGGIVGFQMLKAFKWLDYQGGPLIAWKSVPLSMFVTQRGLLFAIPAGLLLLCHWREKFFRNEEAPRFVLPFWVEVSLYSVIPLFHVHTFLALSVVLGCFFLMGNAEATNKVLWILGSAFVPATFFVWLITDHFTAHSMIQWHLGWVQNTGEFKRPFFQFWWLNFGIWIPLVAVLIGFCVSRELEKREQPALILLSEPLAFLVPAIVIFAVTLVVKLAPWEWDNLKILIWAYFIVLPFLWSELIAHWAMPVRVALCIALFGSGFVSLLGGLAAGRSGFEIAKRAETDGVGDAVKSLPVEARFAAYPTYNHPLLLQGRKVVLGYPGHLWTQGYEYQDQMHQLEGLMRGDPNWRELAQTLHVRYLFWGREEKQNYAASRRPWEREGPPLASGPWGAIYDLEPQSAAH